MNGKNLENIYKHFLLFFLSFKDNILNIQGNKLIKNGEIKDNPKLIRTSFIRYT